MVTVRLFHLATWKITIRTIKDNSNSDSQEKEGGREETRTKNCAEPSYLSWLPQSLKKYKIKHKTET